MKLKKDGTVDKRFEYGLDHMKSLGSVGGQKSAIGKRMDAIIRYYSNPRTCVYCDSVIDPYDNGPVSWIKRKKFCSSNCQRCFKRSGKVLDINDSPRIDRGDSLLSETKNSLTKSARLSYAGSLSSKIREHSRAVYNRAKMPRACVVCSYNKHIEVAHIKPVSEFDNNETIAVINSLDNLVALCPNHHWEFDNGLIDTKTIEEKVMLRYQDQ